MRRLDAWALGRLLCGRDGNGELQGISEAFRPLSDRLAALPLDERKAAFDEAMAGRSDADAIRRVVFDSDPEGPAPEDDGDDSDGWEPIRLGTLPEAPAFPLDVLPLPARDLAEAAARSIACPVDFPAAACLAAAAAVIGQSARLRIKAGYFASAALYLALVGSPSSGKSPALSAALAPVWFIGRLLHERWRTEMDSWEATPKDERGPAPALQRIASSDPTTEALGPILAENPRGLIVAPDEMTKWAMSMDQYKGGKGGDRPFWLSAWNGEPIFIDRAKNMREPIAVLHPFLCVVGGMTPDMLSTLPEGRGRDDGFMARLLFACPERTPRRYSEEGVPEAVAEEWRKLALALWSRPMRELDKRPAPHVVCMSAGAANAWAAWCHAHYAEQEDVDFPEGLEGPWGKLEAYAGRLALIVHLMHQAADPTRPPESIPAELPRERIDDAVRLVAYFKGQARRVYAAMGGRCDDGGEDTRALLKWIVRNKKSAFSTRDIGRNLDRFHRDPLALSKALGWLEARHLIRPRPEADADPHKPGRKPAPAFDVNPALLTDPRFRRFRQNTGA